MSRSAQPHCCAEWQPAQQRQGRLCWIYSNDLPGQGGCFPAPAGENTTSQITCLLLPQPKPTSPVSCFQGQRRQPVASRPSPASWAVFSLAKGGAPGSRRLLPSSTTLSRCFLSYISTLKEGAKELLNSNLGSLTSAFPPSGPMLLPPTSSSFSVRLSFRAAAICRDTGVDEGLQLSMQ